MFSSPGKTSIFWKYSKLINICIYSVPSLGWIEAHQLFPIQPNAQNLYAWKLNSTIVSLEEKYLFIEAEFTGELGMSFAPGEILFLVCPS